MIHDDIRLNYKGILKKGHHWKMMMNYWLWMLWGSSIVGESGGGTSSSFWSKANPIRCQFCLIIPHDGPLGCEFLPLSYRQWFISTTHVGQWCPGIFSDTSKGLSSQICSEHVGGILPYALSSILWKKHYILRCIQLHLTSFGDSADIQYLTSCNLPNLPGMVNHFLNLRLHPPD